MSKKTYIRHLWCLRELYSALWLVSITALVLCVQSCATRKGLEKTTTISAWDSAAMRKISHTSQEAIPPSKVGMTATTTKLAMLPTGAGYNFKSGQAGLTVTRGEGDTLYIYATCDSLQRIIDHYEEERVNLLSKSSEQIIEKPPDGPTGWQWFWIRIGQLAVIYAVCRYLLPKAIKWITTFLKK